MAGARVSLRKGLFILEVSEWKDIDLGGEGLE